MKHHHLQNLTTKYNVLVEELNTMREQYNKHYQNHANTLLFLQMKNQELHQELAEYKKVMPVIPPHTPYPKKKNGYENGDFLDEDRKVTPMPNVSIIPHPIPPPHPQPPVVVPKCFNPYYSSYPHYYDYLSPSYPYSSYPYNYPYSSYPYYREGPKPKPRPPIHIPVRPPGYHPIHPPGYLPGVPTPHPYPILPKDFLHDSDSDSDDE
uniref:Uncharacterized protein n=1 Tax=viral metagenome TaxID=1070528 RepID=A0A6C0I5E4_9ZZZZ